MDIFLNAKQQTTERNITMLNRVLYDRERTPLCTYCEYVRLSRDKKVLYCKYKGIVVEDYSCKRFKYDPLKRIPRPPVKLPTYSADDFKL